MDRRHLEHKQPTYFSESADLSASSSCTELHQQDDDSAPHSKTLPQAEQAESGDGMFSIVVSDMFKNVTDDGNP
jgi:hypothetical protein